MKTIYIRESKLSILKESNEHVKFGTFFNSSKEFLKSLLKKANEAELPELFSKHGFSKEEIINKMKKVGLLRSKEEITEVPIEESKDVKRKLRSKHTITYSIPKNRFMDRMKVLYKELFEENQDVS